MYLITTHFDLFANLMKFIIVITFNVYETLKYIHLKFIQFNLVIVNSQQSLFNIFLKLLRFVT